MLRSHKRGLLTSQYGALCILQLGLYQCVVIEVLAQLFVDGFIHPILSLFVATIVKVAVLLHKVDILVYHIPYLFDAKTIELGSDLVLDLCSPNAAEGLTWDVSRLSEGVLRHAAQGYARGMNILIVIEEKIVILNYVTFW